MEARTLSFPFPFVYYRLYPPFFTSPPFPSSPFSPTGCLACLLGPLKPRKASRQAPDLPSAPFLPSSLSASPSPRPHALSTYTYSRRHTCSHMDMQAHTPTLQVTSIGICRRSNEKSSKRHVKQRNPSIQTPPQALRKFHCSTAGRELTGNLVVGGSCSRHPWPWGRRHLRGYGGLDMCCVISGAGGS